MQEIDLPSGKKAVIKETLKFKHAKQAYMMLDPSDYSSPMAVQGALISVLVEVDGQRLTMEDVDEMDFMDAMTIVPFLVSSPEISRILSSVSSQMASPTPTS